jgi:hypothetical protein
MAYVNGRPSVMLRTLSVVVWPKGRLPQMTSPVPCLKLKGARALGFSKSVLIVNRLNPLSI